MPEPDGVARWDGLFADLEAQLAAAQTAERAAEVDERARMAFARITLRDRLRPAVGEPLRVRCSGGLLLAGVLRRIGSAWLLLDEPGGRESVVLLDAVRYVTGAGRLAAQPDSESVVESRLGIAHVLRGLARDRSPLRLHLADGEVLAGTLDRVGRDFVELAVHAPGEPRRRASVRDVQLVPVTAVAVLRRDG